MLFGLCCAVTAHAQSQGGGLPATNQRVTALEASVKGLQSGLAAEAAARKAADEALQAALAALQASVNSLQALIINSTTILQNQINTLATNVQNLSTSVASLQASKTEAFFRHTAGSVNLDIPDPNDPDSFPPRIVLDEFFPPGDYIIYAHVDVRRSSSDGGSRCFISTGPFDGTSPTSANESLITDTDSNTFVRFVLMSRATLTSPGEVQVLCASPRSSATNASITAIRVSTLDSSF